MAASLANEPSRRVAGDPAVVFQAMPLAVLGTEDPLAPLVVLHGEVADSKAELADGHPAGPTRGDELEVTDLCGGERFDGAGRSHGARS